jgi:hypothetical protein
MYNPTKIVRTIKSITAKEIFRQMPEVKKQLWGGEFCIERRLYQHSQSAQSGRGSQKEYVKNQGSVNHSTQPAIF